MSVDVEALKLLAQEKKLPLERLINAIENEVAKRYAELPVAKPHGRRSEEHTSELQSQR